MNKLKGSFSSYDLGLCIVGWLTVAFAVVLLIRMVSPIMCEMAKSELQSCFNKICNQAVLTDINLKEADYNNIVIIDRSENGEIRGMTTDILKVNTLKSRLSLSIQSDLDELDEIKVEFPAGGFFGIGGGFKIPVKLVSVNLMEAELVSSFEGVGINQTRFCLNAVFNMTGKLVAFGKGQNTKIQCSVPVLMTVVVGNVPSTYVNVKK